MTPRSLIWITPRDGSIHATNPPILAAGQSTLCGLRFERRDLRIRAQAAPGEGPANSCPACREAAAQAVDQTASETRGDQGRKAPLWP